MKEDWKDKLEYQIYLRIFRVEVAIGDGGENTQTKVQRLDQLFLSNRIKKRC